MLKFSNVQVICLWQLCAERTGVDDAVSVKKQLKSATDEAH